MPIARDPETSSGGLTPFYIKTQISCQLPEILKQVQDDDFMTVSSILSVTPVRSWNRQSGIKEASDF